MKSGENVIKLRYHAMRTFRGNEGQSGEGKKIYREESSDAKTRWPFIQIQKLTKVLVFHILSFFNGLFINILKFLINQKTNNPFSLCIDEMRHPDPTWS